jgi:hypothetical protein
MTNGFENRSTNYVTQVDICITRKLTMTTTKAKVALDFVTIITLGKYKEGIVDFV